MSKIKRRRYKKKRYLLPITLIVVLLIFRIALPYIVKDYVNKVLADIPGYYGHVEDINLALIRGAYTIHGMYLNKVNANSDVPFLDFKKTDISIEWKALIHGKIVSEIIMTEPTVIYVFEDQQQDTAQTDTEDWSKALTDLVPMDINQLTVKQGKFAFLQLQADPNIDLNLSNVNLSASNLRNVVERTRTLPSTIYATAVSIGNGNVILKGDMNLVKEIPDMDISFSLEKANAKALNDFTNFYAGIDFDEGTFDLFGEMAIADGYLKGSFKPILRNAKLIGKDDGFLKTLWEGFVGFFKFLLKNHRQDTLATKIPIEGDLNSAKTKIIPTITGILKNAWIKAYKGVVDDDLNFKDATEGADALEEKKSK
ncbi:DUF748 domain-containing protein [Maribacter confluentis]|uniref:DUF748 domain-containing protein n=1 Tax=Maribacter confluentis TaxID=1656093 RepID=A0ABT8RJE6_9FLAO|nr:DUF748 domain-containing protein [Maribacter confluentis]MDO1511177.1 DUF748 domain-containing protein [Maribacter confluentis]